MLFRSFIASHPVDEDYTCDNPIGSGLTPLVYGDLDTLKFGIAVNDLHNDGTLQVGGNITPSSGKIFNLGSSSYSFKNCYISDNINLASGTSIGFDYDSSGIVVNTNFYPNTNNNKNLTLSIINYINKKVNFVRLENKQK